MAKSEDTRSEQWEQHRRRADRATRTAAVAFLVAIVAALGLVAVYLGGGNTQAEGVLIFLAFTAVGIGLGVWVKVIVREPHIVEERYPERAAEEERQSFADVFADSMGEAGVGGRRRFLIRLLGGVGASLGLALLLPFRSLGPGPENELFTTPWRSGQRLVDDEGHPVRPEEIDADQVITVFPEDAVGSPDAQALLIGTRDGRLDLSALARETVTDLVCYSKICTHAGCPVGLYRARAAELLCPCHQSTFDVLHGARVISGPAGRPLPQLPIGVDEEGYLVALGDFNEPVGPSFWNMRRDA